jgi:hypothetical protein
MSINRREFLARSAIFGGAVAMLGPFHALSARAAAARGFDPIEG